MHADTMEEWGSGAGIHEQMQWMETHNNSILQCKNDVSAFFDKMTFWQFSYCNTNGNMLIKYYFWIITRN